MDREALHKLTDEYLTKDKEYREYLASFFTDLINGKIVKRSSRTFTPDEISKIEKMEDELEKVHKEWWQAVTNYKNLI